VLKFPHVDVGEGWLIFGLPPSEVAVHPGTEEDGHEFYLMCDDAEAFVREMKSRGRQCGPVQDMGWGKLTHVTLPGGGRLAVYAARHARPKNQAQAKARSTTKSKPKRAAAKARSPAGRPAKKKSAEARRR